MHDAGEFGILIYLLITKGMSDIGVVFKTQIPKASDDDDGWIDGW
jgi:hypothetical protein